MQPEPRHGRPVIATCVPVAVVVTMHAAVSTAVIAAVRPDVPDIVVYWLVSVLGPSLLWAVLVIGRASVWRRPSAFWLGASAGAIVVIAFIASFVLVIGDIRAPGIPLALIYSSWILLGCAVAVALVLRASGRHADPPFDAEERAAPPVAPVPEEAESPADSANEPG